MTARNRAFCLLSCAVLVVEVSRATTITSGYVIFDNGVHTPDQRGWGRGISVDLVGIEPVFELTGGDADTSFVAPGVISDGFAFAPTSAMNQVHTYALFSVSKQAFFRFRLLGWRFPRIRYRGQHMR